MAWIASVIALVVFCAAPAQAQNYPAKPIHILVPYAPGGISDIASRILGAAMTTWVTFAPAMLLIFAGAPFVEQLRANRRLSGALAREV